MMSHSNVYEEPWNEHIERYLNDTMERAQKHVTLNEQAGYEFRRRRVRWGLPGVIIPIVLSPITAMVGADASQYLASVSLLLTGVFTGVSSFFNFEKRAGEHFMVALLYSIIVDDIKMELTKMRQFRMQADVFMVKINMLMNSAALQEPVIPQKILDLYG